MTIELGGVIIGLQRKNVKHVHLSVHPPTGRVTLVTPKGMRLDVARAYAAGKLGWIRKQQTILLAQTREAPRRYVERESHYLWGRRYLLSVIECDAKPQVKIDHRRIRLFVRPGAPMKKRAQIMHEWHKDLLHEAVPSMIEKWEPRLGVTVAAYFLQRMKTRWGGCNHRAGNIRLNTELVKKPKDLLEYVLVHEMLHLRVPNHGAAFLGLLDGHYPSWRDARMELNELPLSAQTWRT